MRMMYQQFLNYNFILIFDIIGDLTAELTQWNNSENSKEYQA